MKHNDVNHVLTAHNSGKTSGVARTWK